MRKYACLVLLACAGPASAARAADVDLVPLGENVEQQISSDEPITPWTQDPEQLARQHGDRLEERPVLGQEAETVKLKDAVPPIRFASGVADIPPSTIQKLREILDQMQDLTNVRLHVVGHADSQPLSPALADVYGDNAGLSRERAGEVAEYIQRALNLAPESVSFEWAGDTQPIASNATEAGRALNRRVEVEIWYDVMRAREKTEEVLVPEDFRRVKVCRMQTVCKLRYREGHERRARVRNLVPPLHYGNDTLGVPDEFVQQVAEALHNLRDKQNLVVKFIGYSDDAPLTGRAERIYGTQLALSKAQAHRVALAVRETLGLESNAVASEGHGTERPIASNDTELGRSLNRRVEVEFWHDDPLQVLPDEPQLCPDPADAELVTRVYDPPWGRIPPLPIEDGQAEIPDGYLNDLRRALDDVSDKKNPRLRFVGYTKNERLDRRTAMAYGDDVGLSTARAGRTMKAVQEAMELPDTQVEHEGRGFVSSNDVVNAGFLQGDTSQVAVEVVYDELAPRDDLDGVEITRITREIRPTSPLQLNLMHITVDGEPIDDPARSSADIQRCTDVALEKADIHFRYDGLASDRSLGVNAQPSSVGIPADGGAPGVVRFHMRSNYAHFIARSEVRIFEEKQSVRAQPLDVVPIGDDGTAEWQPPAQRFTAPVRELRYVLRAYDAGDHFDETAPQPLWLLRGSEAAAIGSASVPTQAAGFASTEAEPAPAPSPAGNTASELSVANIPLGSVGRVQVQGSGIPPRHRVWVAGEPVPVGPDGAFAAESILPTGTHTVEVAVLDEAGNGELFLRDLRLDPEDWFWVGTADLTLSMNDSSGPAEAFRGENAPFPADSTADGRLAFFVTGRFGEDWKVTASADTREGPVEELFTNFLDKSPEALFRRLDPDYYYPTFGDDSVVEEMAPTLGKLFAKVSRRDSHALWGNFDVGYHENELALVERGLYGGNLRYGSDSTTSFGERRLVLDGFAAEPGTVASREEFRGTGGSLYFLQHQDILVGSERLRIETRDKVSGLVSSVVYLKPGVDYDIDPIQGRILLSEPLSSTASDSLLVRGGGALGDEAWLVAQYEYTPGLQEVDALTTGGQGHYWLNDFVKVGLTASDSNQVGSDGRLYGGDMTLRLSSDSWLKLQAGDTDGLVSSAFRSDDGGFGFLGTPPPLPGEDRALAYRADLSLGLQDVLESVDGHLNLYFQQLDAGYSAPGLATLTDTQQYGGVLQLPVTDSLSLSGKVDSQVRTQGLETAAQEIDARYEISERWSVGAGMRHELREDSSPIVPVTQTEGDRTDAVVQLGYDSQGSWEGHVFGQGTVAKSGSREANNRLGLGGSYRVNDRLLFEGEVSHGNLGPAARVGTRYRQSEFADLYVSYSLDNERREDGLLARRGSLISGAKLRFSDSASIFVEERHQLLDQSSGVTRSTGFDVSPTDRWSFGGSTDIGTLTDQLTGAEIRRKAGALRAGYAFDKVKLSSALEYRDDDSEALDGSFSQRTTWLLRGDLKYQLNPDWRVVGKLNYAQSDSSLGQVYDGGYTEAVLGYAYRPVAHDRLNVLGKYTYFYNVPTLDAFALQGGSTRFLQKSHVAALDVTYDLTENWTIGAKAAYRLGQVSLDRESPDFFDNNAQLGILRVERRIGERWEASAELRTLNLPDLEERRIGALLGLYRYVGDHLKVGVGYNFTDFSDDLTDLRYDHRGMFVNVVGAF